MSSTGQLTSRAADRQRFGSAYLDEPACLAAGRIAQTLQAGSQEYRLGVLDWKAAWRPFADGYHPHSWRGWWDFGTGALGDMACHTCNLPFMGLNMRDLTSVEATHSGHYGDSYPSSSTIHYEFSEIDGRSAFKMTWYDGGNLPSKELFDDFTLKVEQDGNKA